MALIKAAANGGLCEVDDELAEKLLNDGSGQWVPVGEAVVAPAASELAPGVVTPEGPSEEPTEAVKPKRHRRTKAQIEADNAAAQENKTEE